VHDENALRKATFQEDSAPVVMADGQKWYLPRPYVEFCPRFEGGRLVTIGAETHLGPEFDLLTAAAEPSEAGSVTYGALLDLGAFLLRWNYHLADEQLGQLLRYRKGDAATVERFEQILDVASGHAPKA
jgi:hypothetical protein